MSAFTAVKVGLLFCSNPEQRIQNQSTFQHNYSMKNNIVTRCHWDELIHAGLKSRAGCHVEWKLIIGW